MAERFRPQKEIQKVLEGRTATVGDPKPFHSGLKCRTKILLVTLTKFKPTESKYENSEIPCLFSE